MGMIADPLRIVRSSAASVEEIRADVAAHFVNGRFEVAPDARRGQTRVRTCLELGQLRIDQIHAVGGRISGIRRDGFELAFAARGALCVTRGPAESATKAGSGVVSIGGCGSKVAIDTAPRSVVFFLSFAPALLESGGRGLFGDDFELDTACATGGSDEVSEALARNASTIFVELAELSKVGLGALAIPAYEELLATMAVAWLHPERWTSDDVPAAGPRLIQKAQEIIGARVADPLTVHALARELGVTTRTLQLEFRKHQGCTPRQFLLKRRLVLARERLLCPEFGGNVQYVAMSCGFMSMSAFSSRYRATFGELPSETLARGRRS